MPIYFHEPVSKHRFLPLPSLPRLIVLHNRDQGFGRRWIHRNVRHSTKPLELVAHSAKRGDLQEISRLPTSCFVDGLAEVV